MQNVAPLSAWVAEGDSACDTKLRVITHSRHTRAAHLWMGSMDLPACYLHWIHTSSQMQNISWRAVAFVQRRRGQGEICGCGETTARTGAAGGSWTKHYLDDQELHTRGTIHMLLLHNTQNTHSLSLFGLRSLAQCLSRDSEGASTVWQHMHDTPGRHTHEIM